MVRTPLSLATVAIAVVATLAASADPLYGQ